MTALRPLLFCRKYSYSFLSPLCVGGGGWVTHRHLYKLPFFQSPHPALRATFPTGGEGLNTPCFQPFFIRMYKSVRAVCSKASPARQNPMTPLSLPASSELSSAGLSGVTELRRARAGKIKSNTASKILIIKISSKILRCGRITQAYLQSSRFETALSFRSSKSPLRYI